MSAHLHQTPNSKVPQSIEEKQVKEHRKAKLWEPKTPCDHTSFFAEEKENLELQACTFKPFLSKNRVQKEIESELKPWDFR